MTSPAERTAIIEAAYRVLSASGGDSVAVSEILRDAGLSTRAFYRHFDSKDALLLAMFRQETAAMTARLEAAVAAAPTTPDALRVWVQEFLRVASSPRRRQRAVILSSEEVTRARGYLAARQNMLLQQERAIADLLRRGLLDGSFPWADPAADARSVRAAIGQAFDSLMHGLAEVAADEAAAQVVDFAFRAVGHTAKVRHDS
ncbi:TetR/AcrR family transcriptional regulator [Pseudonocardia pini]|uniref:TetR/AcrR family transcriptional regulator n=1 Tax=Pseudonocardia pini TaxID=2758030 RepID=UPI0028AC803B|nr:helix-turn-helix domain-containing protein [Pseudonocardia pini]